MVVENKSKYNVNVMVAAGHNSVITRLVWYLVRALVILALSWHSLMQSGLPGIVQHPGWQRPLPFQFGACLGRFKACLGVF